MNRRNYGAMLAALALGGFSSAQAQTTILTLSCDGKFTMGGDHSEPVNNMGVVVDLAAGTVAGFGGVLAQITRVDAAGVSFSGSGKLHGLGLAPVDTSVWGEIDRVTGAVTATTVTAVSAKAGSTVNYDLMCKPARALF